MGQTSNAYGTQILATTFTDTHITYIRGYTILHPLTNSLSPEFVISHELGHIILHTDDEHKADKYASARLAEFRQQREASLAAAVTPPTLAEGLAKK